RYPLEPSCTIDMKVPRTTGRSQRWHGTRRRLRERAKDDQVPFSNHQISGRYPTVCDRCERTRKAVCHELDPWPSGTKQLEPPDNDDASPPVSESRRAF